ncbi:hypothetical protein [Rhizobium leguminosarum]|uniref:hypothetical protein n=1 Tax=Rhizobium leguminosarum TaxID=384 RepID=UPI001C9780C4|nr:hypothetical protein [Rhizobium leguminosarum]MBY5376644.1 hypothetical protein [Rhizobium leguminosarum]
MIEELWIYPPLASARMGSSPTPCGNFTWGPSDTSPGGTGKTTLVPLESLELDADGQTRAVRAGDELIFKDRDADGTWRFRPVCPYFELHGRWNVAGDVEEGPITPAVLAKFDLTTADVRWTIKLANLKAYQFTLDDADRVECMLELQGDTTARVALEAISPSGEPPRRLIPGGLSIPVGSVQLSKPTAEFPELRMRFHPPTGLVYGPSDLLERIAAHPQPGEWRAFDLPDRLILNPDAAWPNYVFGELLGSPAILDDFRKTPRGIHATFPGVRSQSLGLVDEVTDGIIICKIGDVQGRARVAVGPPDFAPDRRHPVSMQDGLADRVDRATIRAGLPMDELEELVRDIFERALETSDAMNKDTELDRLHGGRDAQERLRRANGDRDQPAVATIWPTRDEVASTAHRADALPVSFAGRRKHKRYVAVEYLRDRLREDPALLEKWIRRPRDGFQDFDRRMPPLMRGSHGGPMNVTQRQYEMLTAWVAALRTEGLIG